MDNSIYVTLSRQLAVMRDMEATANNIANADTAGYNAEKVMFTDYITDGGNREKISFAQDIASYRDTQNGPLKVTGNPFDLAVSGPGYFAVETGAGTRYTKAGNFTVNGEGILTNPAGYPVLDQDGQRIVLENTDRDITVGETGFITAKGLGGAVEERGQIGLFEFADEQKMERLGGQLYNTDQQANEPLQARIVQGSLEGSNVNPVIELVRTTELSRSTTSTAKLIEVMYDLQRKTSNTYARNEQ